MTWLHDAFESWRSGSRRGQLLALGTLLALVAGSLPISVYLDMFPLAGYFLWLIIGMLLLRFAPLLTLAVVVSFAGTIALVESSPVMTASRWLSLTFFYLTIVLLLFVSSRQRDGLPSPVSTALLAELRGRLDAQGRVPELPDGWRCQTAMVAAHGIGYAGDFMVADHRDDRLDLVLVDVVGKGVKAAPSALMLAGALGGLTGALRGEELFRAANDFLLRQGNDETFATAVHVSVDLTDGKYSILSAGHPPALRWCPTNQQWVVDNSRGLALGILDDPDLEASHGVLEPGQALLFYTDGVVEARGADIEDGIGWLQEIARKALGRGFDGAARRVIRQVPRGDDDRALLILSRT